MERFGSGTNRLGAFCASVLDIPTCNLVTLQTRRRTARRCPITINLVLSWKIRNLQKKFHRAFYTGTKPPEVTDVRKYNRAVAILWFVYAGLFELLGLPFLFLKQNAAGFLWVVLGTVAITIALMIVYNRILRKYEQKK